jgi:hypothetical protein
MNKLRLARLWCVVATFAASTLTTLDLNAAESVPIGWWKFDGDATDSSASGNNGEVLGDVEFSDDVPDALGGGQALSLANTDGVEDQGITIEGTPEMASDTFTLAYWIRPASEQGNAGLERLTSRGGDVFETAIGDRNALAVGEPLTLSYYQGGWNNLTETTVPLDEWTHVAWRNGDETIELFVNGEKVFEGPGVPAGRIPEDAVMNIGTRHNSVEGFDGLMDDVRLYDVALTDEEIAGLLAGTGFNPIGLWSFDIDAGDRSGNGNNGQFVDGAELSDDVPAALAGGKSLSLSGGSHVLVEHAETLNITDAITIAAWVKPVGDVEWDGIIAKNPSADSGDNHAGNYELRVENGGRFLHFLHQQGGANDTAFQQGQQSIIESDVWSHVAVTADTESGDVNFYINGELSETLEGIITIDEFPTNENPLYIGSRRDLFTSFDGLLDEVALFDRVLSEGDIATLASGPIEIGERKLLPFVRLAEKSRTETVWQFTDRADGSIETDTIKVTIDGEDVTANAVIVKEGPETTVTYTPNPPFSIGAIVTYLIEATDDNGNRITKEGEIKLKQPLLPFETPLAGPDPVDGAWIVRYVFDAGTIGSLGAAVSAVQSASEADFAGQAVDVQQAYMDEGAGGILTVAEAEYPDAVLDNEFWTGEDFVVYGHGFMVVEKAGTYTFGVHTDDGFAFRIMGAEFTSNSGPGLIDEVSPDTLAFPGTTGDSNTRGVVNLAAGAYEVEFIWYERGGGDHGEVYSAEGEFLSDDETDTWALIGDAENGGLALGKPGNLTPFQIISVTLAAGSTDVTWKSREGAQYTIQTSTNLVDFLELTDGFDSQGETTTYKDDEPHGAELYYRVREDG